ncbi:MAG: flavodoxin family protein [Acidobacteria bacterium]|nr:flavodoxin family protein [Acidobacteriota bacterium]
MKILGLSFSPREKGNTEILMDAVLAGAGELGAETELYRTADKRIEPCDACGCCFTTGECPIGDDMQGLYLKMLEADGILFGTPVYFYNMTAQGKTVIDRTIALNHGGRSLSSKVGAVVAVAGSLGLVDALKDLYFYMVTRQMLPASYIAAYGSNRGDVKDFDKCMQASAELGRKMVKIIKKKFVYPDGKANYMAFGTHTF